jgi:ketosteroid isomerase-like protein
MRRPWTQLPWWIAVLLIAGVARGATNAELAEQVRAAETAFAKSMADRKIEAFESFVANEAIFYDRTGVLRGKAAVVAGWKPFFADPQAPFSWAPESVQVLDSGTLALSSGPVRDAAGKQIGTFNSVWRLEGDGRWRVVFDKGCPVCEAK